MKKLIKEWDASDSGIRRSSVEGMAKNIYFQACINENLRYTLSFVVPLLPHVPKVGERLPKTSGDFVSQGYLAIIIRLILDDK